MQRIPTLDGWRGVAILLVLIDHFLLGIHSPLSRSPWIEHLGLHGVTIFFVLSGYLITSLILRERERSGHIDLLGFYRRRFFRLMPAAWCFLAFAALVTYAQHRGGWLEIIACLFFFRNFVEHGGHQLTLHFWTLSMEEQFYLVWPAVLLVLGRCAAIAVLFAGTLSVVVCRHLIASPYGTETRADPLLIGCLAAMLLPRLHAYVRGWMSFPLLLILALSVRFNPGGTPVYESVTIAVLLITTSAFPLTLLGRALETSSMRRLGLISYSVYLWQEPVCLSTTRASVLPLGILALGLLSFVSYVLIEKPLRSFGARWRETTAPHLLLKRRSSNVCHPEP